MKFEMKNNGRKVTSASQIERELTKAAEHAVEESIRKAAGPGVRIKKTRELHHRRLTRSDRPADPSPSLSASRYGGNDTETAPTLCVSGRFC